MAERGSTQHSPRIDEQLERETESLVRGSPVESRAESSRQMEAPGEGEVEPDSHLSIDDVERRSQLAIALRPSVFPAKRDALVAVAEEQYADDSMLVALRSLPGGRTFKNVEQVWETLGGKKESRTGPTLEREPRPAPRPARRAAVEQAEAEPSPSIAGRVCGFAVAGVELMVGLAIEAVQQVRRRLPPS